MNNGKCHPIEEEPQLMMDGKLPIEWKAWILKDGQLFTKKKKSDFERRKKKNPLVEVYFFSKGVSFFHHYYFHKK